eukprot:scaffold143707_cov18-Tisochrysis_lutea.AAC.1
MMEIDEHIGCAMSGLTADAKMLIDHARAETQVGVHGSVHDIKKPVQYPSLMHTQACTCMRLHISACACVMPIQARAS